MSIVDDDGVEGVVSLSAEQPQLGLSMTATLTDADGGVTGTTWQWSRGDTSDGAFTDITNATSTTYRPAEEDLGKYLKATATYTDSLGSGKTASGTATAVVGNDIRTFLSNLRGHLADGTFDGNSSRPGHTTRFRTGSHPEGYKIDEVRVGLNGSYSTSTFSVHIYSSDDQRMPDSSLYRMVSPDSISGWTTFRAPVGARLEPDTEYHLAYVSTGPRVICPRWGGSRRGYEVQEGTWGVTGSHRLDRNGNAATGSGVSFSATSCIMSIRGEAAIDTSHITDISITSTPAVSSLGYGPGDTLKTTVTMSEAVTVDNTTPPTLSVEIGANTRAMTYNATDSTGAALVFEYTTVAEDEDTDGVSFESNALTGTITRTSDNKAADLEHAAVPDDPDAKVLSVVPVIVSFGQATYSVDESDDSSTTNMTENEVAVKVTLSADPERSVTIPITKTNEGGALDGDYSGVPESVTFASGDTEKTITFTAVDDADNDDGESVKLGFGALPTGVGAGATVEATVSIVDEDEAQGVVSLSAEQPEMGISMTASLTDADGGVTGTTWQWSRGGTSDGAFTDISGAMSPTRPAEEDLGKYLKATATYTDSLGSGKTASGTADNAVHVVNRTFVGNLGQLSGGQIVGSPGAATPFRTGGHPAGYKLSDVVVALSGTYSHSTFSVHVYSSGSSLYQMVSPDSISGVTTFTAPVGERLSPDTQYYVALVLSSGNVQCAVAHNNRYGSGRASDWSTGRTEGVNRSGRLDRALFYPQWLRDEDQWEGGDRHVVHHGHRDNQQAGP